MGFPVTEREAVYVLERAREELAAYEKMLEAGELDVELCPDLARHAWVRAVVFDELDAPGEVAAREGDVVLELQQYLSAVYAMQGVMGLTPLNFEEAMMSAVVVDVAGLVDAGCATVSSLVSDAGVERVGRSLRVAATCAVWDTDVAVSSSALLLDERVTALPVLPREFVTAVLAGAALADGVFLASSADGSEHWLDKDGERYSYECLPDGSYKMRGDTGVLVSKRTFVRAVNNLVLVPSLMAMRGYCYLLAVPPAIRQDVAAIGPDPRVSELRRVLPRSGQWCGHVCKYVDTPRGYHILSSGSLPLGLDANRKIGVDSVDEVVEAELRDTLRRMDARKRAAEALVGGPVPRSSLVPQRVMSQRSGLSLAVADVGRVGFSRVDSIVSYPVPADLFSDAPKHAKRDDALVQRLDAGGPLSDSYLRKADNRYNIGRYLPAVRSETGRVVLLPDAAAAASATTGVWKPVDIATGWRISRMSLRKLKGAVSHDVVVGPMVAARLDTSAVGEVVVGGLRVPGQATVVWFQGAIQFTVKQAGGSVALSVPVSGAATGPGWLASTAVSLYGCPYVKPLCSSDVVSPELLVLRDEATSKYGLTRTSGSVNVRVVGSVELRVSSDTGRDGLGMFTFSGGGLRSVEVAGVLIMAVRGQARVIADNWQSAFVLNLTSPGKVKAVVDFVSDAGALEAKLRPSPDTPSMPQFGF